MSHPILSSRGDWTALQKTRANISKAEAAYRNDPELAADLEQHGWDPEREAAAWQGRAIKGNPALTHGPVLDLDALAGKQVGPPIRLTAWAEFTGMRSKVAEDERVLRRFAFPEVRRLAQQREVELQKALRRTAPEDAGPLVQEYQDLLQTHQECADVAGMRDGQFLPSYARLDYLDFLAAALREVSLLDPVLPDPREPRTILRRPEGGVAAQQIRTRRDPVLAGVPVQRSGPSPDRLPPIRPRTVIDTPPLQNPAEGASLVPPPPDQG